MQRHFLNCIQNIPKRLFINRYTVDKTYLYYFEPKRKSSNRIWASTNAIRPCIAKRLKKVEMVTVLWLQYLT